MNTERNFIDLGMRYSALSARYFHGIFRPHPRQEKTSTADRALKRLRPRAALAGGEVRITGSGLRPQELRRPKVKFGEVEGAGRGQLRWLSRRPRSRRRYLRPRRRRHQRPRKQCAHREGRRAHRRKSPPCHQSRASTPKATSTSLSPDRAARKFPSPSSRSTPTTR